MCRLIVYFLLVACSNCLAWGKITCRTEDNEPVDWYVVYKYPKLSHQHQFIQEGLGHAYADEALKAWHIGNTSLNSTGHAIYNTLQQIYEKPKDMMYLMYNDQPPELPANPTYGHTKGVLAFDKTSGFWLIHSVPHFPPPISSAYSWPKTGTHYGQNFLCITLSYQQLNDIAKQLYYTYPCIYDKTVPKEYLAENPDLGLVINSTHPTTEPWNRTQLFNTQSKSQRFNSYAKFSDYDRDIYDSWIAPAYQSTLRVESWQNGPGKTPSNCTSAYKVYNVQNVSVDDIKFKETQDHSKWAITDDNKQVVCIGGINRQHGQLHRAGGTVCTHSTWLWKLYNDAIVCYEPCASTLALVEPNVQVASHGDRLK